MLNFKFTCVLLFLGMIATGCKKPPVACMELSESSVPVGTPIEFVSCSENTLSYEWFMEEPEGAPENQIGWSDPSFSRAFTIPGSYTVTLSAYSEFSFLGEKVITEQSFSVN